MENLKLKINELELEIELDLKNLSEKKNLLINKIKSIKTNLFFSELIIMSFAFGYLLAPKKNPKSKSNSRGRFLAITLMSFKIRNQLKKLNILMNNIASILFTLLKR